MQPYTTTPRSVPQNLNFVVNNPERKNRQMHAFHQGGGAAMSATTVRPIDHVLDALHYQGPREGHTFTCLCPTHDDRTESLSVTEAKDGKVLIHCHAGCDTKAIVTKLGLTFADLQPPRHQKPEPRPKGKIVATYDYVDEGGKLLYQAVRLEPKQFRQRRPGSDGVFIWNLGNEAKVLYQLPRLLAASADSWIFVVEGEKDANNLIARELVSTTNAMGAGKWLAVYNHWLQGRRVCILPDNDDPGRSHAQTVARNLQGIAAQVRVLELSGLPNKGDVSDWLAMGHNAQELLALVEAAPDYIAPVPETRPEGRVPSVNGLVANIDRMLIDHPIHDHGNAQVVDALHPGRFSHTDALGWMQYVGTHWETDSAEVEVHRAITDTLIRRRLAAVAAEREDVVKGTTPNEAHKNAIKGMYRDLVTVSLKTFDSDPNVLNCANGVIDLRTGQLVAHGPSNHFTYCAQAPYSPTADASPWLNFLAASVEDYDKEDMAVWLQMALGYSITGQTYEECMFYIHGPARSGKGTFTQAPLSLLGSPLARGVDFSTFTKAREGDSQNFDLAPLRPSRFIAASESGRYSSLNEAVVKNITGNDPITASFKYHDDFTYQPQFKIWLSSNHPVKGDVDDDAFWGRVRVISFPEFPPGP